MDPLIKPSQPQAAGSTAGSLDPQAVNLAKAIRQSESGGDFTAKGKSGEYGAYQYTEPTWAKDSAQSGINVPLQQATPEQQNEVAYKKIKQWKDRGFNVGQIASMWNAGEGKPNAYLEGNTGTNKYGVKYDTGAYAKSVASAYQKLKQGDQVGVDPNNPSSIAGANLAPGVPSLKISSSPQSQSEQGQGLGQDLVGRGNDISNAINQTLTGKINPLSGLVQGAGAIAGGVGDIVNRGLELIPGFKGIENLIGQGIGALAKTEAGQSVGKAVQDFSSAHPELAKDIGAGFNIVTALPIFEGLGALKNVAMDGVSVALKNIAEKGAAKDLTEVASRTIGGRNVISAVPDAVQTMVKERALPNIVNGRYYTEGAASKINNAISEIDKNELQPILNEISKKQNFGQNLGTLKKLAIKEAQNDTALKEAGMVPQALKQIEKRFEGWKYSYGDSVDLSTENRLKIGTGKFSDWGTPEGSADKSIYHALQKNIEEVAKIHGMPAVDEINQRMGKLIKTQDLFKYINGKAVKNKGIIHGLIQSAAIGGGEAIGNSVGVPLAGAVVGNKATGLIERTLSSISPRSIRNNILDRTAPGAVRQTTKGLVKRGTALTAGTIANHQSSR